MPSFRTALMVTLTGCLFLTGCSLVGTWCVIEVEPGDAPFPIASATFANDGTYCVSHASGGRSRTDSGAYRWTGWRLELQPEGKPPRTYSGYLRLDGKLVLSRRQDDDGKITAVLEKQADERTGPLP